MASFLNPPALIPAGWGCSVTCTVAQIRCPTRFSQPKRLQQNTLVYTSDTSASGMCVPRRDDVLDMLPGWATW
ncbi:hypothetical protein MTO96_051771 [Rhipicephalus appendiculatus]